MSLPRRDMPAVLHIWDHWDSPYENPISAESHEGLTTPYVPAAALEAAQARIAALEEALRFYADPGLDGYDVAVTDYGLSTEEGHIIKDGGAIARAALAESGQATRL